jgi:hypothetical protein
MKQNLLHLKQRLLRMKRENFIKNLKKSIKGEKKHETKSFLIGDHKFRKSDAFRLKTEHRKDREKGNFRGVHNKS